MDAHQRIKATRSHAIKTTAEVATTNIICQTCSDGALATSWCVKCLEFICFNCVNAHQRIRVTKDHKIISKESFQLDDVPISAESRNLIIPTVSKRHLFDLHKTIKPE